MNSLAHNPSNATVLRIADISIRQDADGRYCLNDLHKAAGSEQKHRPKYWLEMQQTIELINEIEIDGFPSIDQNLSEGGIPSSVNMKAVSVIKGGRGQGSFVCKDLVYSYAMWISAKFHLHVIRAYDAMVMKSVQDVPQISTLKIKPEQKRTLHDIVDRRAQGNRKLYAQLWGGLNRHYRLGGYADLLECHFADAVLFLERMVLSEDKLGKQTVHQIDLDDQAIKQILWHAPYVWNDLTRSVIPALRVLDSRLAGSLAGHMTELMCSVNILQRRIAN